MAGAAASLRTVAMVVGAGYGGSYMYNNVNSDGLRSLAAEILLRERARERDADASSRGLWSRTSAREAGNDSSSAIEALSAQMEKLSRDVQRSGSQPVVVVPERRFASTSSIADALTLAGWSVIVVGIGAAVVYVCVWRGYSVKDLLWVSRTTFNDTIDTMQAGLSKVTTSVASVRRDLTDKLRSLENTVENVRRGLGKKIEEEIADVKEGVDNVGRDVEGVQEMLHGFNDRMELLDGKLDTATTGIVALVRVISTLAPDKVAPNSPFQELRRFAELTSTPDGRPRVTASNASFMKSPQLPSSFAAAALEDNTPDAWKAKEQAQAPVVFSRRNSMPRSGDTTAR